MQFLQRWPSLFEDVHDAAVDHEASRKDLDARFGAVGRFQLDLNLGLEILEKVFGDISFRRRLDGSSLVVRIGVVIGVDLPSSSELASLSALLLL